MFHGQNTEHVNWATLMSMLLLSGVKVVQIDAHAREPTSSAYNLNRYSNHDRQNYSPRNSNDTHYQSNIEYSTQIIPYEYIVKFSGFYKADNRQNFIDASLSKFNLNTKDDINFQYRIIKRQNIMSKYPSDFDLVEFYFNGSNENQTHKVMESLVSHPLIKSVTPQQKVTRSLREVNKEQSEDNSFSTTSKNSEINDHGDDFKSVYGQVPTFIDRLLHYNTSGGCGDTEGDDVKTQGSMNSWIRGRRSLTYGHSYRYTNRRLLKAMPRQITATLQADILWQMGVTGAGVKVAIFDTGLSKTHPHFKKIRERTNWTNEKTLNDELGHGTFVAGVIASSKECLGFAPDAELHIFRVFTKNQVSYTSWFLDAFNYAIMKKINVLNLSIGGPDFKDTPFVEKVIIVFILLLITSFTFFHSERY